MTTERRLIESIKADWERTKTRLTHWWASELYDRAVLLVTAPKAGAQPTAPWPGGVVTPEVYWADTAYNIWRTEEQIRTTYFGGEALPVFYHGGGWSVGHALLLAANRTIRRARCGRTRCGPAPTAIRRFVSTVKAAGGNGYATPLFRRRRPAGAAGLSIRSGECGSYGGGNSKAWALFRTRTSEGMKFMNTKPQDNKTHDAFAFRKEIPKRSAATFAGARRFGRTCAASYRRRRYRGAKEEQNEL